MLMKRSILKIIFCIILSLLLISSLTSCDLLYNMLRPTAILEVVNNTEYSIINIYCIMDGVSDVNNIISSPILPNEVKTIEKIDRDVTEIKVVFENEASSNYETDFINFDKLTLKIK